MRLKNMHEKTILGNSSVKFGFVIIISKALYSSSSTDKSCARVLLSSSMIYCMEFFSLSKPYRVQYGSITEKKKKLRVLGCIMDATKYIYIYRRLYETSRKTYCTTDERPLMHGCGCLLVVY